MASWRRLILFGDSLTQYSFQVGGWGSRLADELQRKVDVLNRGFSGYNTDNAVKFMKQIFPPASISSVDAIIICFGANDASLSEVNESQSVPVQRYSANLREILAYVQSLGILKEQIVLVSPPALDEKLWLEHCISERLGTVQNRRNDYTKLYADACGIVASEMGIQFLNLWKRFMAEEDYKKYLCDGLHFSADGNKLVAELLLPIVRQLSEKWFDYYPDWKEITLEAP